MRFRTLRNIVTTVAAMLVAGLALVVPASASTYGVGANGEVRPTSVSSTAYYFTRVPAGGRVSCYGYYGTFLAGSRVMVVDWIYTSDECFGIATDRTIWHAWPNSGGWHRLPGDGHADNITAPVQEESDGSKGVVVWAATNNTLWGQAYFPSTGWTGVWTKIS